jgi:hypothetical protein
MRDRDKGIIGGGKIKGERRVEELAGRVIEERQWG